MAGKQQQRRPAGHKAARPGPRLHDADKGVMPGRSVGTFTSSKPADYEPVDNPLEGMFFLLDNERFDCLGELDLLDLSELAMLSASAVQTDSPQGVAMVAQFMQLCLGGAQYAKLRMHVHVYKTPQEELLRLLAALGEELHVFLEQETGRPTRRPARSSRGPSAREERTSLLMKLDTGDVTVIDPNDKEQVADAERRAGGAGT
jgi:hypothetical protein